MYNKSISVNTHDKKRDTRNMRNVWSGLYTVKYIITKCQNTKTQEKTSYFTTDRRSTRSRLTINHQHYTIIYKRNTII